MAIINEPKNKFGLLQAIREQLEHRALWMYLLCDEARKKGLKKALFGKAAQLVFEMKILRCTDDNLDIDFHYCPLVKAWQKQGCSDEEIQLMCDHAMCGDRGIAESFGCKLELPKTIAKGDGVCQIRFVRK